MRATQQALCLVDKDYRGPQLTWPLGALTTYRRQR